MAFYQLATRTPEASKRFAYGLSCVILPASVVREANGASALAAMAKLPPDRIAAWVEKWSAVPGVFLTPAECVESGWASADTVCGHTGAFTFLYERPLVWAEQEAGLCARLRAEAEAAAVGFNPAYTVPMEGD